MPRINESDSRRTAGPDFRELKKTIAGLKKLDDLLYSMPDQAEQLRQNAAALCMERLKKQAADRLSEIPVSELTNSRAGIRTKALEDAGFHSLFDLYRAEDALLCSVNGVGEKQTAAIRRITDGFLTQYAGREKIRLSPDRTDRDNAAVIEALARCIRVERICGDAKLLREEMHSFLGETISRVRIRNRVHWLLSFPATKKETMDACRDLEDFSAGTDYARAERFVSLYLEALAVNEDVAFGDFEKNSSAFYAFLEKIIGNDGPEPVIYGSIPERLAAEIRAEEVNLSRFRGDLRSYQLFGVQYILHQKKVLLGDEMGLGKTIQAIGVMSHLSAEQSDSFFLIVCPASVMVNWCREIGKFSAVPVNLIHGASMEEAFKHWQKNGGAAVTNYESMRHIADRIDRKMKLSMLVIDEAHYIKNPEAQRTKFVRRLKEESERILLMTGTPLENKVEEMCELIGFLRPDFVKEIRKNAGMRRTAAFKEMLSPVYLRRQAEQVLEELPELTENEEWCAMTMQDLEAYRKEVTDGNFMGMRRVSFLQEDMQHSSKCQALAELCRQAAEAGKKVIVYSWFRESLQKVRQVLGDACIGEITGNIDPAARQLIIDRFTDAPGSCVLLCQTQAGGTGLNIQAASVVIFCEPQIKPSLERQAVGRAYRMGQIHNVLVFHLLCEHTCDEAVRDILARKREEFLQFADESAMADAEAGLEDRDWIRNVIEEERKKYLPAVII